MSMHWYWLGLLCWTLLWVMAGAAMICGDRCVPRPIIRTWGVIKGGIRAALGHRAAGGGTGRGMKYEPTGVLHHAEGFMPDGHGGLIHWQETGDGIEYAHVNTTECDDDNPT